MKRKRKKPKLDPAGKKRLRAQRQHAREIRRIFTSAGFLRLRSFLSGRLPSKAARRISMIFLFMRISLYLWNVAYQPTFQRISKRSTSSTKRSIPRLSNLSPTVETILVDFLRIKNILQTNVFLKSFIVLRPISKRH